MGTPPRRGPGNGVNITPHPSYATANFLALFFFQERKDKSKSVISNENSASSALRDSQLHTFDESEAAESELDFQADEFSNKILNDPKFKWTVYCT